MPSARNTYRHIMTGPFTTPWGRILTQHDLTMLELLYEVGSIRREDTPITLNSGSKSHFYVRLRQELSLDTPILSTLGRFTSSFIRKLPPLQGPQFCLIGVPTAGNQLSQATAMHDADRNALDNPISFLTMRSALKPTHGKDGGTWTGGAPEPTLYTYCSIENASTTGGEWDRHLCHLEEDGFATKEMMHHIVFVDRGGLVSLRNKNYKHVHALWKMEDIVAAFIHFKLWPDEYLEEYITEANLTLPS